MTKLIATLLLLSLSTATFIAGQSAGGCVSPLTLSGNGTLGSGGAYKNNQKCRWIINATPGNHVALNFVGVFDIEASSTCSYDRLVIYDSGSVDEVLKNGVCSSSSLALPDKLGVFCGFSTPDEQIISSNGRLVVEFCSDSSATGIGFTIEHSETNANAAPSAGTDCNLNLEVDKEQLITFYGSSGYQPFANCSYKLTSKNGKALKLTASRFNLEGFLGCRYDSLTVLENGRQLGRFCGSNGPRQLRSVGSTLDISFTSDQYSSGKGFALVVQESCGGMHLCSAAGDSGEDTCYENSDICNGAPTCGNNEDESACDDCGSSSWSVGRPFPGAAAITNIDGQIHCGGALISRDYVLTSAHCFHRLDDKPQRFVVKLGAARLGDAYVAQIDSITVHSLFNPRSLANNLAIIKLAKSAPIQSTMSPFCVPSSEEYGNPGVGSQCYTLGWGRTVAQDINSYASSVKNLTARVVANKDCNSNSESVINDPITNICALTSGKLCYGDNGAPLVCQVKGKWQIVGINSVAFGCSSTSNIPSSFTKVYEHRSWINENAFN